MKTKQSNFQGLQISSLGLGGSRFGSVTGATRKEAEALIKIALENEITFFDTAASYGQGDSERIMGEILCSNDQICLVSKIGKIVPLKARLLRSLKPLIRISTRRSSNLGYQVKQTRGDKLPVCFDKVYLQKQIDGSRRRIGVACIPMVMLHSPPKAILENGDAVAFLEDQRIKGNIRVVGVSVDDLPAGEAALNDSRVSAIQIPFHEEDELMKCFVDRAKEARKFVVAREIFQGIRSIPAVERAEFVQRNLHRSLMNRAVDVSLVGTIDDRHLAEIIKAWKASS